MIDYQSFKNKRIILGVTGSIAAYKGCTIASNLTQQGAEVSAIMTESATKFVTPLTFQALTGQPVYTSMWQTETGGGLGTHIAHVGLAHDADLLLIAPCTAQTMARLAHGMADDLLSITTLAAQCPVLIAPAMDAGMWDAPATQANVVVLRERGVTFAGPVMGRMASGLDGLGRFLEPESIVGHCRHVLGQTYGALKGKRIVISAGPTQETIDPVRYISNHSSGKQGYALAQVAIDAGASVTLVSGPSHLPTPVGVEQVNISDTLSMREAILKHACEQPVDALIMAAAPADFRPAEAQIHKIKKDKHTGLALELVANPDILYEVSQQSQRPTVTIGFAAESQDLISNAQGKLQRKGLDLIVANNITAADAGFAVDTNRVHFVTDEGVEQLALMSKEAVAARIMEWLAVRLTL